LKGAFIDGRHDHRIVMASSVAAMIAEGPSVITDAEFAAVSFPNYYESMKALGASIDRLQSV
jgi:3-phosphoshikimate 1-carboxyvinyltransferase